MKKIISFIILISFVSCSPKLFKEKWTKEQAPDYFKARFETTQGNFDIEAKRAWSPKAVDRLYQLIKNEFYTDIAIFRVVPGFVAQFGIHNDSLINASWRNFKIDDEVVISINLRGREWINPSGEAKYFNSFQKKRDKLFWADNKIEHLPSDNYLFGSKNRLVTPPAPAPGPP